MNFSKLATRTVSGLVYCGVIIAAIFTGYWGVFALAVLLGTLACIEFAKICRELNIQSAPAIILDVTGCICLAIAPIYPVSMLMWILVMLLRAVEQLYIITEDPLRDLTHSFMSQIYIGLPMLLMVMIAYYWSPMILLAMFFFIWINDTGAFLVGSAIGRHRLFERISPKKSWEGFLGGLIINMIAALLFCRFGNEFFDLARIGAGPGIWLGFAIVTSVFATWGDLVESLIKRTLHIKDSGNIIPGHGGILDRIDSLLLVLPAIFLYFCLLAAAGC